jgi:MFS family permease
MSSKDLITFLTSVLHLIPLIGIPFCAIAADKYGLDRTAIVTSTIFFLSCVLKSCAWNVDSFMIGFMVHLLVIDDLGLLTMSAISRCLPYNNAIQYASYNYTYSSMALLLGVPFGGAISSYTKHFDFLDGNPYRFTYIFATFFMFIRLIYILIYIRGTQQNLFKQQLQFVSYCHSQLLNSTSASSSTMTSTSNSTSNTEAVTANENELMIIDAPIAQNILFVC